MKKPVILITKGDPKGIGPEVTEKALADPDIKGLADFTVIATKDNTGFEGIDRAVSILKRGKVNALVTGPVSKYLITASGRDFKGHTEFLAAATRTRKFAMMFCSSQLKVTLVTRHAALKDIPNLITSEKIETAALLTARALRKFFKISRPRIGVCGLNPHCGEGGLTGDEERKIITPAIKKLKSDIPGIEGPISGDTVFYMALNKKLDAVVSMYHDQGLGPFKMLAFDKGVNVTLGLPFVRTSPDHGIAYDIAGKGIANPGSMKEAIKLAAFMCRRGHTPTIS